MLETFPERVLQLNNLINVRINFVFVFETYFSFIFLLQTKQFSLERIDDVYQELNIPVPEAVHLFGNISGDFSASKNGPVLPKSGSVLPENGPVLPKKRHIDEVANGLEGTPVMGFTFGPVASNKNITELCDLVKPYVRQAVEDVNKVVFFHFFSLIISFLFR